MNPKNPLRSMFNLTDQPLPGTPAPQADLPKPLPPESAHALDALDRAANYAHSATVRVGEHQWHDEVERLTSTLVDLTRARALMAAGEQGLVVRLRSLDVPWSTIGPALGMTRQAAQQKYGR